MILRRFRVVVVGVVLAAVVAAVGAVPVLAQWPTTCVELNDIVEAHLGNDSNVGIYQRVFGDQAEAACQNDHRDDVRGVFAWAFDQADVATQTVLPDLAWPTDCVELNDIVEAHLGNDHNVEIYQRVFGDQAEPACRNDHREDVRRVFSWAFGHSVSQPSRLAFRSNRDGDSEIFVMNADGSQVTQLTYNDVADGWPTWAPDGRRLAYHSPLDGDYEIYVIGADGMGETQVTYNEYLDLRPAWSPDGAHIAFESDRDGDREIFVMNADGTGVRQLTDSDGEDMMPAWSPDGTRLVFISDRDEDDGDRDRETEIYVMNSDGTNVTRLTHSDGSDVSPTWSPDGSFLAFSSDRVGDLEIYVMNSHGTNVTRLTYSDGWDVLPTWSPDGRYLAFSSNRDGDWEIYVMKPDGTRVTQVTDNPASDVHPAWSPAAP